MPPKQTQSPGAADDSKAKDITVLCHLLANARDLHVDLNVVGPIIGIYTARNVPRRINAICNPYGFEWRSGKMYLIDDDEDDNAAGPATIPANTNTAQTATPSTGGHNTNNVAAAPPTPKKRKTLVDYSDSD